jgi:putative transposase
MSHSFNKIWVHIIWSTKDRLPLIDTKIEKQLYELIKNQFIEMGCPVKNINGMPEHIHCLIRLNPQKSIADIVKQVKGSTSHFINEQNLISNKFSWQTGYAAFSISESGLNKVDEYIKNQKQHHKKKIFKQEYDEFLKLYGFDNENIN